jgi:hypothetical protein
MDLTLDFEFHYLDDPRISVTVRSPSSGLENTTFAFVDTGAQRSLFDTRILRHIRHHELPLRRSALFGVGGGQVEVGIYQIAITLLGQPALSVALPLAFADNVESDAGNLIGLDVLEHFDFDFAHADRLGYLGRR